jgi:integrase
MKITKTFVEKLPVPGKLKPERTEQKRYYDDRLKGFGIRVTSGGTKAFFVEKLVNGVLKRITIGHYPEVTTESARKEAQVLLGKMVTGIDPLAERKALREKGVTLQAAFNEYLKARKSLKPATVLDYHRVLKQVMPDWLNKPITSINRDMVSKRHAKYGENNSEARSNLAMRLLRAIFNYAINHYQSDDGVGVIAINPVKFLSHARSWYRVERRQTIIKQHQLGHWYGGLQQLSQHYEFNQAEMWKDYFLLVLLTGMRRTEAASLKFSDLDMNAKTFTLRDTKNRDSHTLPMSEFIFDLFQRRKLASNGEYVFPASSNSGHIMEPRKAMLKIIELSGVQFTVHDCRRTFITAAESLDISAYAVKRLANHKMNNDITSGYIVSDVERLRKPMQQITEYFLKCLGVIKSADVVAIQNKKGIVNEETA